MWTGHALRICLWCIHTFTGGKGPLCCCILEGGVPQSGGKGKLRITQKDILAQSVLVFGMAVIRFVFETLVTLQGIARRQYDWREGEHLRPVLVFYCCWNKLPKIQCLKTIYSLSILKFRKLKQVSRAVFFPSGGSRGRIHFLAFSSF